MDLTVCGGDCGRRLMRDSTKWRTATREQRAEWRRQGMMRHAARGMCTRCYQLAQAAGTLADYPTEVVPREVVLLEWEHADLDRSLSMRARIRMLAPRLGMTVQTLERALYRAGVAA